MPKIEYTCPKCGHEFKRVVFVEDTPSTQTCPKCRSQVEPDRNYADPITGIIPNDTN